MTIEGDTIQIGDDDGHSDGRAFVFLPLFSGDTGDVTGRTVRPEFIMREPVCISNFDKSGLQLRIVNTGQLISDLVTLEYEVVFCTLGRHGAQDGFTANHASESQSSEVDKYLSMDVIEPMGHRDHFIDFRSLDIPDFAFEYVKNIYFRAQVRTLWEPTPADPWDFANDIRVTEAYFDVP